MTTKIKANIVKTASVPKLESCFSKFVSDLSMSGIFGVQDTSSFTVFPGFCDVHVHFREPGFSYKETIKTGSAAAARGGYSAVCTMPNLSPVPDTVANIDAQLDIIARDAVINVYPYASITMAEHGKALVDFASLSGKAIAFSDDGRGVQDEGMMREAMARVKEAGKMVVAHCEVNDLLHGGYIHAGDYAAKHSHRGICSESEWVQVERDLKLADEIGCPYHVCHISTKETVSLIRDAKASGVDVTCETGPHYLVLDDSNLREEGRFKMNPPLRSKADKEALIEGILDGTIDMIATDHAPHSAEEKARGLEKSAFGIVGLETALPTLNTHLVKTGILTLEDVVRLMATAPRERFGIPMGEDLSVWNLDEEFTVDPAEFLSMGKATPFEGDKMFGRCYLTVAGGKIVWKA